MKITHSSGTVLLFFKQTLNDAFLGVPSPHPPTSKSLIMSCRALYDPRHVSYDAPSVCPAVTEGLSLLSFLVRQLHQSSLDCHCLYIKTMPCQSELVCPSPWVEPCHYFSHTREKVLFSTCYRKCNIGMSSWAAGTGVFEVDRWLCGHIYTFHYHRVCEWGLCYFNLLSTWLYGTKSCCTDKAYR